MSNVLDLLDQTMFDFGRASESSTLLQCIWVYDRPVNMAGLHRFHGHLQRGRLSRCIAQSPLPFGRSRWVAARQSSDLENDETARERVAFDAWLDQQVNRPLDCERGPGWHLATLPFTDGGSGVSLVISHCLTDGVGLGEAVADAVHGRDDAIGWPTAASRRRWQAVREDAGQTMRDIPAIGRAVSSAIRFNRQSRRGAAPGAAVTSKSPASSIGTEESYNLPTATVFVDADKWDARAHSLGGTGNTLLVGLAARLAQRAGRVATDGSVVVTLPVNERSADDTRANAISGVRVTIDPAGATTDLRVIRAAVKRALIHHREVPDPEQVLNALVPLLSKRLLMAARSATRGAAFNLVGASNLGAIDAAAGGPDGSVAESFAIRLHHLGVDRAAMQQYGGLQTLLSGTVQGRVFVSLTSYLPGHLNSKDELRQELSTALSEHSLAGTYL